MRPPLDPPRRLLMGSGPSNAESRVLRAMAAPPLAADDPSFQQLLDDVATLERDVFQAPNATGTALVGASRAGLEAALTSLIEPGDRVLVGVYGHFGELLSTLATRHGARVDRIEAAWGRPVDADGMAECILRTKPRVAAIVHADTSTGVLQPLASVGAACRAADTLLLADVVLSVGGCEVDVDSWAIDVAVGGLQKCLGGPPGMALLTLSSRAETAMAARRSKSRSAYLDLTCHHAETSTTMLLAAREALRISLEEGLVARWLRHELASRALRAGLAAMGLELFGSGATRVPMITLVNVPDGIDEAAVRQQLLAEHGIEIMAAFGPLRGRVWRVGTMGANARMPSVLAVLSGLEAVLAGQGLRLVRGAAVDAAKQKEVSRQLP